MCLELRVSYSLQGLVSRIVELTETRKSYLSLSPAFWWLGVFLHKKSAVIRFLADLLVKEKRTFLKITPSGFYVAFFISSFQNALQKRQTALPPFYRLGD